MRRPTGARVVAEPGARAPLVEPSPEAEPQQQAPGARADDPVEHAVEQLAEPVGQLPALEQRLGRAGTAACGARPGEDGPK